jgi:hypothetical protein
LAIGERTEGPIFLAADGRLKDLQVTADSSGIVSHAGIALIRALADKTGSPLA